jgi:hypothetical protein
MVLNLPKGRYETQAAQVTEVSLQAYGTAYHLELSLLLTAITLSSYIYDMRRSMDQSAHPGA